ncbi:MAG TPA: OmpA family protein [Bacteroidia bacterium]|mgnify:FL=1|jgi:peptidoglycan-associated lipoprotein|nr:OmpA family protein [Bacteroidia bacterium]HMU18805.1 OmpA family protein [Bacteroidia bacterium]
MNRKRNTFLLFAALLFTSCLSVKQRTGDTYYEQNLYDKAIPYYQEVANKKLNLEVLVKLADCYRNIKNYQLSEQVYSKIVSYNTDPIYQFYYAEALMQNGKYVEARKWLNKFLILNRADTRALNLLASCDSIEMLYKDSLLFDISRLPFNGIDESNFSPELYYSGIVYVSNRNPDAKSYKKVPVIDNYNLFYAQQTELGHWMDPVPLRGTINSIFNEGPCSFNNKFTKAFVTRNANEGKKIVTNQQSENVLEIFEATTKDGEWNISGPVNFNNNNYSVGHPSISPSGNTMVFVSDMPWGYGGTDIYRVEWINNTWSKPVSLGKVINTSGNEMFPFLLTDSILYFSSNGMIGVGGLDIYRTELTANGWTVPENLGFPINSPRDDFGFICDKDELSGYFSSNRQLGKDNIFSFKRNPPILTLKGKLIDKTTSKPLKNYNLKLTTSGFDTTLTADNEGNFSAQLKTNKEYTLRAEDKNYFTASEMISTFGFRKSATLNNDLTLEKVIFNKPVIWRGIAFEKGKSDLTPATKTELNKLFNILLENKNIKIELSCHTDSRGAERDNLIISQARADKATAYLIGKGISKDRIISVGYGSQRLLNNCVRGVLCLEEDHQINIRTEIKYSPYQK